MRLAFLALLLVLGGCGYFNTMYNAKRAFSDAEKAVARGELANAQTAFKSSIDKATKHLTKKPNSRWSTEARLIIGRANLALGNYADAERVFTEIAQTETDAARANGAKAYLGVIAAAAGDAGLALSRLNEALSTREIDASAAALGYLTRARIHLGNNAVDAALADLTEASRHSSVDVRAQASLLRVRLAALRGDSAGLRLAVADLLSERAAQRYADSLQYALRAAQLRIGGVAVRNALSRAEQSAWVSPTRDSLILLRADLAIASGDTVGGIAEIERFAGASSGLISDLARVRAAEFKLARATSTEEVNAARALLLPAIGVDQARFLIQSTKTLEVLLEKASRTGQPVALFAAAELARDELRAPRLAARLFTSYAEIAPQTVWAPKALIAALPLADAVTAAQLKERLQQYRTNPYASAVLGKTQDDAAYEEAEVRLARLVQAIRAEALVEAVQRDNSVTRAAALIDSVRLAARTDSTRISCGIMIDSLAIAGIRADSVRAACLRHERDRIATLLKVDTLLLRDSTKARADSARAKRPRRDTTHTQ